jgi:hypothetical protein
MALIDVEKNPAEEQQITEYLEAMFFTLCDIYTDQNGSGALTPGIVDDLLLGYLFDYAVGVDWIADPPQGPVMLGNWDVPEAYRDAFATRVEKAIFFYVEQFDWEEMRRENRKGSSWRQPTPDKTIHHFCKRNRTPKGMKLKATTSFVKIVAGSDPDSGKSLDLDTNLQKRIQRLIDPKKHQRVKFPITSEVEFSELLADKMMKYDPKGYGSMDRAELARQLRWIPAKSE